MGGWEEPSLYTGTPFSNNGQFSCGPQTVQQAKAVLDQVSLN